MPQWMFYVSASLKPTGGQDATLNTCCCSVDCLVQWCVCGHLYGSILDAYKVLSLGLVGLLLQSPRCHKTGEGTEHTARDGTSASKYIRIWEADSLYLDYFLWMSLQSSDDSCTVRSCTKARLSWPNFVTLTMFWTCTQTEKRFFLWTGVLFPLPT